VIVVGELHAAWATDRGGVLAADFG
jgi:hypothetical protein